LKNTEEWSEISNKWKIVKIFIFSFFRTIFTYRNRNCPIDFLGSIIQSF